MTNGCRLCGSTWLRTVLDLGKVPAADWFPAADTPIAPDEAAHELRMVRCGACGLAQLADDDTVTQEPRGVEPQALREQAAAAVRQVSGLLTGGTVREFGSPHGGTWLPLLTGRGYVETRGAADLVLDSFGIMHRPDQGAAILERAAATAPDGVLLLQFHSLAAIVALNQWNALRHGHFAYYSLAALRELLADAGMSAATAWTFPLYGGTTLVAARHGTHPPDAAISAILAVEEPMTSAPAVARLQFGADRHIRALRERLTLAAERGQRVYAYGAASRAVAVFSRAGLHRGLIAAVADASPAKQGRRMPGTDIPIVAPAELLAAAPDLVLLTLPDLLAEVRERYPELDGRWLLDEPAVLDGSDGTPPDPVRVEE
ncbi:methyltransferase domain-containing protein [Nocardia panacis]|uniref:Methyltransferase domain-containing protein n=1 Tax=Nocardia panacis TaxID=2340916 RepID=A0A3A4K7L4_9NOCA|nr:class I SAM-dependent methyltransferase [Nocardia panacis]RJO73512.1 methyltransferase domain-containing protein [Nocardia panacis]